MAANWWTDPMPAGWEAKWSPDQNRYFFIDHSTKKTTWVDPRSPEGKHQVRQPQPVAQPRAQQYGYGQGNGYGGGTPAMQMQAPRNKPKCSQCRRTDVITQGDTCTECVTKMYSQQETSFSNQQASNERANRMSRGASVDDIPLFPQADEALLKKLKGLYPSAFESHVRAALESNNNNEVKANADLVKRGYKKVDVKAQAADKLVNKLRPTFGDCPVGLLRATIISCDCKEALTLVKLKDLGYLSFQQKQEKEKEEREQKRIREEVTRNITRDFASIDGDVLQMALEAGEYNEEMIRGMLESLTEEETGTPATRPVTPAVVNPPKGKTKGKSPAKKTTAEVKAKKAASKTVQPPKAQPAPRPTTSQNRTRIQVTAPQKTATPSAKPTPVQPVVQTSNLARGPDKTLAKGADDSLLLKGYCSVLGPNPDLVNGPSCNVMGTQGAIGPDSSLVHGPIRQAIMV